MRTRLTVGLIPVVALIATYGAVGAQTPDSAAFIVRLGSDTTSVERYVRTGDRLDAISVTRSPRTTTRRLTVWLNRDGSVARYATGDATGEMREQSAADGAIPIVNGFYVPWELALMRAVRAGVAQTTVAITTGMQPQPIAMNRASAGTWRFSTQFDQPVEAVVDGQGRMRSFAIAGGGTTVERVRWVDIDGVARAFAARDQRGAGMGALSPLDSVRAGVGGATIVIEYSRPSLRGRDLDVLVPPGQVWRMGANNATTFETDRAVSFGNLRLDPGTYSLFAEREADRWILIINRQTGMSGLDRDPAQDLGRVEMRVRRLDAHVETFTIAVEAVADGAMIRLRWGRVEASTPFRTG